MEPLGAASMSWIMPSKSRPTVSGSKYLHRLTPDVRQRARIAAAHGALGAQHQ